MEKNNTLEEVNNILYFQNKKLLKKEVYRQGKLIETFKFTYDGLTTTKFRLVNEQKNGIYLEWYNGILIKKIFYKNNLKNGYSLQYYSTGSLRNKTHYVNNKKNGVSILWLPSANLSKKCGPISQIFHYKNDKLYGKFVEYLYPIIDHPDYLDNPGYIKKGYYKNGLRKGVFVKMSWKHKIFEKSFYHNNLKHGKIIKYNCDGNIIVKGNYANGCKEGKWLYYSQLFNSIQTIFWKKQTINFQNNLKYGKMKKYYPNGSIYSISYYLNDKIEGKFKSFFYNQNKDKPSKNKVICYYKNNQKNGVELIFNKEQKLLQKNYFKNDLQHGINFCYQNNIRYVYYNGNIYLVQNQNSDICSICYEKTKYQSKCNHSICQKCFYKMNNTKCPICRNNMNYNN